MIKIQTNTNLIDLVSNNFFYKIYAKTEIYPRNAIKNVLLIIENE